MGQLNNVHSFLRDKNFIKFWAATVLSALGDSANYILVSWFVVDVTGSEAALGTTLLCMSLPRLFFMLAGGVVADRINRKTIMALSLVARAAVVAGFGLILAFGNKAVFQYAVYLMAIVFGIVDAFFWPARDSLMPQVVAKENLARANSMIQTSQQLSMVIGPLLASLLLQMKSYPLTFGAIASAFTGSMLLLSSLRFAKLNYSQTKGKESVLKELSNGIRYTMEIRPIALLMVASLFMNLLIMGPLNIALPVLVKKLGWAGSSFGYLEGAVGMGAIIGGLLTGAAKGFRGHYRLLPVFIACMGLALSAVGYMHNLSFGLTAMLAGGMMMSMVNIPVITYVQTVSETAMLGRVMSLLSMTSMGLGPVSYAITSFVLQQGLVSAAAAMKIGGCAMAVVGLCTLLFKDFRSMEEHPAWKQVHNASKLPA